MDPTLIEQIGSALFTALEMGIRYAPAIISDLQLAYRLVTSGTELTEEQQAQARAAVASAHAALQAQLQKDMDEDTINAAAQK